MSSISESLAVAVSAPTNTPVQTMLVMLVLGIAGTKAPHECPRVFDTCRNDGTVEPKNYPEKVPLSTIRNLDGHPCPHCLILKSQIPETGTKNDMKRRKNLRTVTDWWLLQVDKAREAIFDRGLAVNSAHVEKLLKGNSWVLTKNAFAILANVGVGLNLFGLFVPDVLHEVELGTVKAIFIQTVRLLYVVGDGAVGKLDQQFRHIPTFGRSTIRRFHRNVSAMKQFAARDYEDTLQCQLPAVEGLFPENEKLVLDVWFDLAAFHGMAKLRLHTTKTLADFRVITTEACASIRKFARESEKIKTYETPTERDRRLRRLASASAVDAGTSKQPTTVPPPAASTSDRKERKLNTSTYKFHVMPDYPDAVKQHGTLDSYTTQNGEMEHRKPKKIFGKTNKRDFVGQIAKVVRRQALLRAMLVRLEQQQAQAAKDAALAAADVPEEAGERSRKRKRTNRHAVKTAILREALRPKISEIVPQASPKEHHRISESQHTWWKLDDLPDAKCAGGSEFGSVPHVTAAQRLHVAEPDSDTSMSESEDEGDENCDPALTGFVEKLQDHIWRRLLGRQYDDDDVDFTRDKRNDVEIKHSKLFTHATMRLNYTTYDLRREQDSVSPRSRPDIMVVSEETDAHPYEYARVLGIFHVLTCLRSQNKPFEHLDFLWVRWYSHDTRYKWGWKAKCLPRFQFLPHDNPDVFGFLDPNDVLRGAHLIPAFHHGRTNDLLPPSIARRDKNENDDWKYVYGNFFVDRDMMMRYCIGDGVGHQTIVTSKEGTGTTTEDDNGMDVDEDLTSNAVVTEEDAADGADSDWEDADDEEDASAHDVPMDDDGKDSDSFLGDESDLDDLGLADL
ncbi:hypothetical protein GGX14DRAFT_620012 [Mycena pura]|uniref:Uncharacterized protein n=1 Tax=Mycena pura TaxID=153505 RepID=A0AAD6VHD9_9AGAR|nr:hypothetical protein GGX14DRAFT_620012 [Mycena pura]